MVSVRRVHAIALIAVLIAAAATALLKDRPAVAGAQGLVNRLIKFRVTGTFESMDPSGGVTFSFSGPFFSTSVDPATGTVSDVAGPHLGEVQDATVHFRFDPSRGVLDADSATFNCDSCMFLFNDGSVVEPILADLGAMPPQQNIPMQGRLLFSLGPAPAADASFAIRGIGCGGAKETAGEGGLAGMKGGLCVNGTFGFSKDPTTVTDPAEFLSITGNGESNCTLVMHRPFPGF